MGKIGSKNGSRAMVFPRLVDTEAERGEGEPGARVLDESLLPNEPVPLVAVGGDPIAEVLPWREAAPVDRDRPREPVFGAGIPSILGALASTPPPEGRSELRTEGAFCLTEAMSAESSESPPTRAPGAKAGPKPSGTGPSAGVLR